MTGRGADSHAIRVPFSNRREETIPSSTSNALKGARPADAHDHTLDPPAPAPKRLANLNNKNIAELRTACEQAARKAKAVAEAIREFLQITGFGSATDQKHWKVLPFVVTNQAIGVGSSFDGIPIVDRQILNSYLGQGGYYPGGIAQLKPALRLMMSYRLVLRPPTS